MKKIVLLIMFVCSSAFTFAAELQTPLLVVEKGGLANVGTRETCAIYSNHPALAGRNDEILNKIMLASADEMKTIALFMQAQVPSIEIYAYEQMISLVPMRVDLEIIYSNIRGRTGSESVELINLAKSLCPNLF